MEIFNVLKKSKITQYIFKSDLRKRFTEGAVWAITGSFISRLLSVLSSIAAARILGKSVFGEIGIIQSTIGTFGVFAGMGLGMSATKYIADYRIKDPVKAGKTMALSTAIATITAVISSLLLVIFAPVLANHALRSPKLTTTLIFGVGILFFGVLNGVQTSSLSGLESFKTIAIINLVAGSITFPVTVLGAWLGNLNGYILGLTTAMFLNYIINKLALNKECKKFNISIKYNKECLEERGILWKFTLPAAFSSFLVMPVTWIANIFLVNSVNGYAEMGLLNACQQWQSFVLYLPTSLGPFVFAILSSTFSERSNSYWKVVKFSLLVNFIISSLAAVVVYIMANPILHLYGDGFTQGSKILGLLVIAAVTISISNVVGQVIASSDSMWIGFFMNLAWSILFIIFTFIFIRNNGAFGMAIAYLLSYSIHLIYASIYLLVKLKIKKSLTA